MSFRVLGRLCARFAASFCLLSLIATLQSLTLRAQVSFDRPDIDTGKGPISIAQADFNRDGRPDVVTANFKDNTISVLLNNGDNTFARTDYPAGKDPRAVITADFNNDGIADVAVAGDQGVTIFLGAGDGTLRRVGLVATDGPIAALVAADFNRDGKIDLAAINGKSGVVSIFTGNGDGAFNKVADYPTSVNGSFPSTIVTADFNHDGLTDLAVANGNSAMVIVFLGNGDGSFRTGSGINVGNATVAFIAVADFNQDGNPDLLVTTQTCQDGACFFYATIYAGAGDGSFAAGPSVLSEIDGPLVVADFNGDHVPDFAAATRDGVIVALIDPQNPVPPFFSNERPFPAGWRVAALAVADFNGDGIPDVVTANTGDNTVTLLIGDNQGGLHGHLRSRLNPFPNGQVIAADVNRDGVQDLVFVTSSFDSRGVWVALGRGDGSFAAPQQMQPDFIGRQIAVADLNHDGIPDLVVTGVDVSGTVSALATRVLLGNTDGTFTRSFQFTGSSLGFETLVIADFNGDGVPDIALLHCCDTLSILLGNGDGTFRPAVDTSILDTLSSIPQSMAVGDFDGDGKMDVVIAYGPFSGGGEGPVKLFLGNGNGTFRAGGTIASFALNQFVVAADFNRDGRLDLVVSHTGFLMGKQTGFATLFLGNGDGTFRQGADMPLFDITVDDNVGIGPGIIDEMEVADLNNDGLPDLLISNRRLTVLVNNGDGTFQPRQAFGTGGGGLLAIADFNGDGKTDVAVASGALAVFLNTTGNPRGPQRNSRDGQGLLAAWIRPLGSKENFKVRVAPGDGSDESDSGKILAFGRGAEAGKKTQLIFWVLSEAGRSFHNALTLGFWRTKGASW